MIFRLLWYLKGVHPSLCRLSDTQLQRICALFRSPDRAVHQQGLELLQTLAPAGPTARRGLLLRDCEATASLEGCDLAGSRFVSHSGLYRRMRVSNFRGVSLVGTIVPVLSGMDFSGADLRFCSFSPRHSFLEQNVFTNACLRGADFSGNTTCFRGVDLWSPTLEGIDLRDTDLRRCVFRGGRFRDIDFSGANFGGADLCGANFKGAKLVGADLTDAELYRVNFKGVDLSGATLTFDPTIRWDDHTRWPDGIGPAPGQRPSRIPRRSAV